jgi:glycosyltransferase involved in cell wall biosynthesis
MPRAIRLVAYTNSETVGGAERCLMTILAGLPPSFHITVAATDPAVGEAVAAGCGAAAISPVQAPTGFWDVGAVAAHRRVLRGLRPQLCVVNLQTPYSGLHATLAALLVPRLRVVAVEHLPLPSRSRAAHRLKRATSRRLAAHVAVSEATADSIAREAGLRRERMHVVRNGVSEPAGGTMELGPSRPVVGGMGRLDRQKGFDVLVDALALLPGVSAVVAGDGPERGALERRAHDRGIEDRFTLLPWTAETGPFLRALDLFLLPSRYEGLPLALLEAMAAGTPVVAADVGAVNEAVVAGTSGLLVPPDDAPALAAAVRQLLDDEAARKRLAAGAREAWRSQFTAERMQESYLDVFTEALR